MATAQKQFGVQTKRKQLIDKLLCHGGGNNLLDIFNEAFLFDQVQQSKQMRITKFIPENKSNSFMITQNMFDKQVNASNSNQRSFTSKVQSEQNITLIMGNQFLSNRQQIMASFNNQVQKVNKNKNRYVNIYDYQFHPKYKLNKKIQVDPILPNHKHYLLEYSEDELSQRDSDDESSTTSQYGSQNQEFLVNQQFFNSKKLINYYVLKTKKWVYNHKEPNIDYQNQYKMIIIPESTKRKYHSINLHNAFPDRIDEIQQTCQNSQNKAQIIKKLAILLNVEQISLQHFCRTHIRLKTNDNKNCFYLMTTQQYQQQKINKKQSKALKQDSSCVQKSECSNVSFSESESNLKTKQKPSKSKRTSSQKMKKKQQKKQKKQRKQQQKKTRKRQKKQKKEKNKQKKISSKQRNILQKRCYTMSQKSDQDTQFDI